MAIVVVTGTDTEIGKTVATAAVAAASLAQGLSVAVLKPAQTGVQEGEPGDAAEVARLAGAVTAAELARYPEPLAPATAAARAGLKPVGPEEIAEAAAKLAAVHDVVLVEGAGGLLVRYDEQGSTLADAAAVLRAGVLLVAPPRLGTLNVTTLTAEALAARELNCLGVIVGSWPAEPGLAERCNIAELPAAAGAPLLGALPERAAALSPAAFRAAAPDWLAPQLGGTWDAAAFSAHYAAPPYAPPAPQSGPAPVPPAGGAAVSVQGPGAVPAHGPGTVPLRGPSAVPGQGPGTVPLRGPSAVPGQGPGTVPVRGAGAGEQGGRATGSTPAAPPRSGPARPTRP
jgi:dethiobiotin synthetase